ncbi:MAG TPA: DUF2203 domain-containing protein [Candidatus Methylomirabilis sp.]|nr:DUF2203 domain-containing protein [Candidatus Methylomirabilis sp.]
MPPRLFTVAEANDLLPTLEPLVRRLMENRLQLRRHQAVVEEFRRRAAGNGGAFLGGRFTQAKQEVQRLAAELSEGIREVESLGCQVKDLDIGLVDFPARRGREQVLLCWRLGESRISYWHGLEEGFAGRKPLEDIPENLD